MTMNEPAVIDDPKPETVPDDTGTTPADDQVQTPPEGQTESGQDAPAESGDDGKSKAFTQDDVDRIVQSRLAKERRERERLAAALEAVLARQPQPQEPAKPQDPPAPTRPKPKLEDYDYDGEKLLDAILDWREEQHQAQQQHQVAKQQQTAMQSAFEARRLAMFSSGTAEYGESFDDAIAAIPADVMDLEMASSVLNTESPHKVAFYLGKNLDEARALRKMPIAQRLVAMGKLEARLSTALAPATNAPRPAKTGGTTGPAVTRPADIAKKDPLRYIKLRNEGKIT